MRIVRQFSISAAVAAAWLAAPAALAQDGGPGRATTEFADGAREASASRAGITAKVAMERRRVDGDMTEAPVLRVVVGGKEVLEVVGVPSGLDIPAAEATITEIDPTNDSEEVYFASWTGGAHCCAAVTVATKGDSGWSAVEIGTFDGGTDFLDDLDGDGANEIVTVDQRFLYRFDCYACSASPLAITTLRKGEVVDVTRDPAFREAHREWLLNIEESVEPDDRWTSPGFLAGWVATKALLGEGAAAWNELVARWNWQGDQGEEVCLSGGELERCPRIDRAVLKFPERLKRFLAETGYNF